MRLYQKDGEQLAKRSTATFRPSAVAERAARGDKDEMGKNPCWLGFPNGESFLSSFVTLWFGWGFPLVTQCVVLSSRLIALSFLTSVTRYHPRRVRRFVYIVGRIVPLLLMSLKGREKFDRQRWKNVKQLS